MFPPLWREIFNCFIYFSLLHPHCKLSSSSAQLTNEQFVTKNRWPCCLVTWALVGLSLEQESEAGKEVWSVSLDGNLSHCFSLLSLIPEQRAETSASINGLKYAQNFNSRWKAYYKVRSTHTLSLTHTHTHVCRKVNFALTFADILQPKIIKPNVTHCNRTPPNVATHSNWSEHEEEEEQPHGRKLL